MSPAKNTENQTDVNIYSPGNLYVTYVERWTNTTLGYTDYYLSTAPCAEVEVDFYHLNTLSPKIIQAFTNPTNCRTQQAGSNTFNWCGQVIHNIKLSAGELMGTANPAKKKGIKQFFDFEMSDHRTPSLQFVNPKRWVGGFDFKHIVCPFDYFTPALRQKFLSQMADYFDQNLKRTTEPLCGTYMQDVAGTAQGAWFKPGKTAGDEENTQITLSHHNVLTQKGVFSVGTKAVQTIEAGVYPFDPKTTGLVNRDFKDIGPDGKIYCFEPTGLTGNYSYPFRIILQMNSTTKLTIEGQKIQGCLEKPWRLDSAATSFER